jgi:hypothetical protein
MFALLTSTSAWMPSFILNADPAVQKLVLALVLATAIVWGSIAIVGLLSYVDFFKQSAKVAEAFKQAAFAQTRISTSTAKGERYDCTQRSERSRALSGEAIAARSLQSSAADNCSPHP